MILALDISTSITGAAVLDDGGKIVHCEAWDTRNSNKYSNLLLKAKRDRKKNERAKGVFPRP